MDEELCICLEDGSYDVARFGGHTHSTTCVMSSLAQLADALPSETRFLTPAERASQCAERAEGYRRRLRAD